MPSMVIRTLLLISTFSLWGCTAVRSSTHTAVPLRPAASPSKRFPVLLVHGIWDTGAKLAAMKGHLEAQGFAPVVSMDLRPNDGSAPLEALARQVAHQVQLLRTQSGVEKVDVVAFSMGTLVSRYYLQRLGGKAEVRKFVSISGPHRGTWTAFFSGKKGAQQMRPNSPFLQALEADSDPWGEVDVTCLYTPMDLMIFPSGSSLLKQARTVRTFPVMLHHLMLTDTGVLSAVIEALSVE
jgi:triacylglycerol esterase/lipase EstA (alpha/beta hydrolase family)